MNRGRFHKTEYLTGVPGVLVLFDEKHPENTKYAKTPMIIRYTNDHGITFSISDDRGFMMQIACDSDEVKQFLIEMLGGKYGKVDCNL